MTTYDFNKGSKEIPFFDRRTTVKITVNGNSEEIFPCSILAFVEDNDLNGDGVVVEHNYHIVGKAEWDTIQLKENDNLEILSFVGGG